MTKKVLKLDNGEMAIIDTKYDKVLFDAYYINGVEQEDGTDVKLHVTKKGKYIFYLQNWSRYQGTMSSIKILNDPQGWLIDHIHWLEPFEIELFAKYGITVEETA